MSPTEIRLNPNYKWRMGIIGAVAAGALYLYLGYLPTIVWICLIVLAIALIVTLITGRGKDLAIILNDEGLFDPRLKVGVIRWEDIRRISSHDVEGALYISLELHDKETYEARRPRWFKLASQVQRVHGVGSIAITCNGLDIDHQSLVALIHKGCHEASQREI